MIGYEGIEGLAVYERMRFIVPRPTHILTGRKIEPITYGKDNYVVQIYPLDYFQLVSEAKKDSASDGISDLIAKDYGHWPDCDHPHAYLKVKFTGSGWSTLEIGLIDFFIDAIRMYTGAFLSEGKGYEFAPVSGPYKPSHMPGVMTTRGGTKLVQGNVNYLLTNDSAEGLREFIRLYSTIRRYVLSDNDLNIAKRYLDKALECPNIPPAEDQILFLTIALEAMFSPSENQELSHRVAENVAFFFYKEGRDIDHAYRLVRLAYDIRSKVAHGAFNDFRVGKRGLEVSLPQELVAELSLLVREAIIAIANLRKNGVIGKGQLDSSLAKVSRGIEINGLPIIKRHVLSYTPMTSEQRMEWFKFRQ